MIKHEAKGRQSRAIMHFQCWIIKIFMMEREDVKNVQRLKTFLHQFMPELKI